MAKLPRVVAFVGPIGSGKTTAASCLKTLGYYRVSFADPLKQMLIALGLNQQQVYGEEKEEPSSLLGGRTPRYAMQTLGSEWGRHLIHQDLWVHAWRWKCEKYPMITVDDLRFTNEFNIVKTMGGKVIKLHRNGAERVQTHESEAFEPPWDAEIINNSSLDHLKRDVLFTVQSF